jgi:hypothetical protein
MNQPLNLSGYALTLGSNSQRSVLSLLTSHKTQLAFVVAGLARPVGSIADKGFERILQHRHCDDVFLRDMVLVLLRARLSTWYTSRIKDCRCISTPDQPTSLSGAEWSFRSMVDKGVVRSAADGNGIWMRGLERQDVIFRESADAEYQTTIKRAERQECPPSEGISDVSKSAYKSGFRA